MHPSSIENGNLGASAVFLNVAPTKIETAVRTLKGMPGIGRVMPVMGRYDIAALGRFPTPESLRDFQAEIQKHDFVRAYRTYPGFEQYSNGKGADGHPIQGIVLVRTSEPAKNTKALQGIEEIQEILGTSGDADLLVWLGAKDAPALADTVLNKIQNLPGIRATETLTALPKF